MDQFRPPGSGFEMNGRLSSSLSGQLDPEQNLFGHDFSMAFQHGRWSGYPPAFYPTPRHHNTTQLSEHNHSRTMANNGHAGQGWSVPSEIGQHTSQSSIRSPSSVMPSLHETDDSMESWMSRLPPFSHPEAAPSPNACDDCLHGSPACYTQVPEICGADPVCTDENCNEGFRWEHGCGSPELHAHLNCHAGDCTNGDCTDDNCTGVDCTGGDCADACYDEACLQTVHPDGTCCLADICPHGIPHHGCQPLDKNHNMSHFDVEFAEALRRDVTCEQKHASQIMAPPTSSHSLPTPVPTSHDSFTPSDASSLSGCPPTPQGTDQWDIASVASVSHFPHGSAGNLPYAYYPNLPGSVNHFAERYVRVHRVTLSS